MARKLLLTTVVGAFGALMLAAGGIAPESLRRPLAALTGKLDAEQAPAATEAAPSADSESAAPPAQPQAAAAPAADEPPPVPYEALLLETSPAPGGKYALQLGLEPDTAAAEALRARLQRAGYPLHTLPLQTIAVVDRSGTRWAVVAAGEYATPQDAHAARTAVARALAWARPPAIIRLPEAKPASPAAP